MTKGDQEASRWRWVVLASSFFSLLLNGYGQYHAGVLKVAMISHLNTDVKITTWLMSYYAGSFALSGPVGSVLVNITSCRTCVVLAGLLCLLGFVLTSLVTHVVGLFLTITLIGIGQGMCNTGVFMALGFYFPEQAGIALGVSISGGALGIFMHPPLLQSLVDWYGLQGALLLSGAVAFHASPLGALMRPCSLEMKATQGRPGGNTLQKLCALFASVRGLHKSPLTSRAMAAFLMSLFVMSLAFHSVLVLLPYHLIHEGGLTPTESSFSVSIVGIGSLISRLASGFLAHDPRVGNLLVYCGLLGLQSVASLAAPSLIAQGIVGCYTYSFMMGLYYGGLFTVKYPILHDIVGLHHVATALGLAFFSFGVGGLVGPPLTELVQETSLHPHVMFWFIGALFFLSTVLGSLVTILHPPSHLSTGPGGQHQPPSRPLSLSALQTEDHDQEDTQPNEQCTSLIENETDLSGQPCLRSEVDESESAKPTVNGSEDTRDSGTGSPEVTRPLLHEMTDVRTSGHGDRGSHEVNSAVLKQGKK
ncbi:monocarboxylate transporter 13-like [Babylonia areolata]|uniref:monocarboxylate transporter 13-like n=1 Tax=Babylonia areolata TaxID=304850 RepID=UPI003FD37C2C